MDPFKNTKAQNFKMPKNTKSHIVDKLLTVRFSSHKTDILAKCVKFYRGLADSPSQEVSFVANLVWLDQTTTTGRNLRYI